MSSSENQDVFLTATGAEAHHHDFPEKWHEVKKDHDRLKEVVNHLRGKVETMVDKQRAEYIQAYESHMQDISRELHNLREKVFEMANDQTKNERTEKLKNDLVQYKSEAMDLETNSDELRSNMSRTVQNIYQVEKSRDWMLRRLRKAKKQYNLLLKEKSRLLEEVSLASMSKGEDGSSTYTVEFSTSALKRNHDVAHTHTAGNKFKRGVRVHASVKRDVTLPAIPTSTNQLQSQKQKQEVTTKVSIFDNAPGNYVRKSQSTSALQPLTLNGFKKSNPWMVRSHSQIELGGGDDGLGRLVALRSTSSELKTFVSQCKQSLHKRPWNKVQKRSLQELLAACQDFIINNSDDATYENNAHLPLVCELAAVPEVYDIIDQLMREANDEIDAEEIESTHTDEDRVMDNNVEILNWQVEN